MEIKAIKLSKKGLLSLCVWRFCLRTALLVVSSRRLVLTLGDLRSTAKGIDGNGPNLAAKSGGLIGQTMKRANPKTPSGGEIHGGLRS
jgi:hypothetical protein